MQSDQLDLLTHGYSKSNNASDNLIPDEIAELIKIWHSNNELPKLHFNLLTVADGLAFEFFWDDKTDCKVLGINKYTFKYETCNKPTYFTEADDEEEEIAPNENGQVNITHFYDEQHLVSFVRIENRNKSFFSQRDGKFRLSAIDLNDNVVTEVEICQSYSGMGWGGNVIEDCGQIGLRNKGTLYLKDWMGLKDKFHILCACDDLLWKRLFYFANFMAARPNNYQMNKMDLAGIDIEYQLKEFEKALAKLAIVCEFAED